MDIRSSLNDFFLSPRDSLVFSVHCTLVVPPQATMSESSCRICWGEAGENGRGPLFRLCACHGSHAFLHQECADAERTERPVCSLCNVPYPLSARDACLFVLAISIQRTVRLTYPKCFRRCVWCSHDETTEPVLPRCCDSMQHQSCWFNQVAAGRYRYQCSICWKREPKSSYDLFWYSLELFFLRCMHGMNLATHDLEWLVDQYVVPCLRWMLITIFPAVARELVCHIMWTTLHLVTNLQADWMMLFLLVCWPWVVLFTVVLGWRPTSLVDHISSCL